MRADRLSNFHEFILSTRSGIKEDHTANYFSHNNVEATKIRDELAEDSLEMLIQWLKTGGNVGIHGESSLRVVSNTRLNTAQMLPTAHETGGKYLVPLTISLNLMA